MGDDLNPQNIALVFLSASLLAALIWRRQSLRHFERQCLNMFRYSLSNLAQPFILNGGARRRAEEMIASTQKELEEKIERRTKQLLESQQFLDSIIEHIPNMIFVKNAQDLRFVRFNKAGEELIGISSQELIGKNDYDFFPKEQADGFVEKDRAVLRSGEVADIPEESLTTKSGVRLLHTKKIPIFGKDKEPLYLLGISEDITLKKQAEMQKIEMLKAQAAREESEKSVRHLAFLAEATKVLSSSLNYRETLEKFAEIVVSNVADWCVIDLLDEDRNLQRIVLFHSDPEKVKVAQTLRQRQAPGQRNHSAAMKVIESGQAVLHREISDELLCGTMVDPESLALLKGLGVSSAMIVPLQAYDRVFGAITLVSSESHRQYNEFDLSVAQDLAKRASFAIENARLFEIAQESNRAKSAFLANMSHEIRTPLGAMIGFADLMTDAEGLPKEHKGFIQTIQRNGRQLLRIVDDILDISKVESEQISIENIRFSLQQVVDDVYSLLSLQAHDKGLELVVEMAKSLPDFVSSDPTRLRQILINVIGNSIKFTDRGVVKVVVRGEEVRENPEKAKLIFTISDTGIGMTTAQQRNLFIPFVQGDSSTTRKFGGTGLGLYLSRKLARVLHGDLILKKSEPGRGSSFEVSVIVDLAKEPSVSQIQTAEVTNAPEVGLIRNFRVLVVDDSADNREVVSLFISHMGGVADSAENGTIGVHMATDETYDAILMDLQMPEMDGFEALAALRKAHCQAPIIALTAHAMKGDRERCLEMGFDDYLVKPVRREDLAKCLRKFGMRPMMRQNSPLHGPESTI